MTAQRGRTAFVAALAAFAAAALGAAGAAPGSTPAPVGDRIDVLLETPTTFSAGEPFHIRHGWSVGATHAPEQVGLWDFRLEVDGVIRPADGITHSTEPAPSTTFDNPVLQRGWIFNFPNGLSGVHTFTGHWIGPCRLATERGYYSGPCDTPNEPVDVLTQTLSVRFHGLLWNPGVDWREAPDHANPSPDAHGNPGVWSYLASTSLVHDPTTYSALPGFTNLGGRQQWDAPGYVNLLVGHATGTGSMAMHSYGGRIGGETSGRSAILGWTSPVDGVVRIRGDVHLPDLSVCNVPIMGSIWSIDRGATTLESVVISPGGGTSFDLTTTIASGENLYFIHDPGFDSHCDMLLVNLEIEKT